MIRTEKLTKTYNNFRAVDELDLKVEAGELFGFLGPNGAGKTTTIRMLTTLTRPTGGEAWINEFNVSTQKFRAKQAFGVVQQHVSLDRELTVWESMELHARLHHIARAERRRRISELLDYVDLAGHYRNIVDELSGGMKRRLMIARALLHRPRLLFLDEPTVGLDAQVRRRLWDLIRRMNLDGATVFLTTHYIEEAEALCGRVGIIHQGKLIALDRPQELRRKVGMVAVETVSDGKGSDYRYFADRETAGAYVRTLPREVRTLVMRDSNLEDVFIELTGRKVKE
ncbi:MAG: ABC transporter ATP-binding protein [Thermoleophilia bacterium]|nr:ABC transporter ATP-binding protein [Thermoleophilia bacterium]